MKKRIIIILIFALVLTGITLYVNSKDNFRFKLKYEIANYNEYSNGKKIKVSIPLDNKIKYVNDKELLKLFKKGTGIIYFGYPTCPWCRNSVPILIDTCLKNGIDIIYYVDVHETNLNSIRSELYDILGPNLRSNDEGEKILAVPDVYVIKNGIIMGHHLGTVESYKDPTKGMNKKQKKELEEIYTDLIKEIR